MVQLGLTPTDALFRALLFGTLRILAQGAGTAMPECLIEPRASARLRDHQIGDRVPAVSVAKHPRRVESGDDELESEADVQPAACLKRRKARASQQFGTRTDMNCLNYFDYGDIVS